MILDCKGQRIDLDRPCVMGILNVTPDSFSDGGHFTDVDVALRRAERMVVDGAAVIDVGGESTRPGAAAVAIDDELGRVIPVIERIRETLDVPVSLDTSKPQVMREAVRAGACLVTDVTALGAPDAMATVAALGVPVCLMHMQGEPRTMQNAPQYQDVVVDIIEYLSARLAACEAAGIGREHLLVDPGFGFGKTLDHNLALLRGLEAFKVLGVPLLVGLSRKSMLGLVTGRPVEQRLAASVAAALIAVQNGASIVRVHDVAETVDALKLWQALTN